MGLVDMFTPDGTVELKISDLQNLFRQEALNRAENRCMINGLRAGVPAEHILAMLDEDNNKEEVIND